MNLTASSCNSSPSFLYQIPSEIPSVDIGFPSDNRSVDKWKQVKKLVERVGVPKLARPQIESLKNGVWVKLICGASFEDAVDVRNLSLVYTLAGVDCIDCAADASIVAAAREGIEAAMNIVRVRNPWIMISVNDDTDLHFRKAEFDAEDCPPDCSRPCEIACPAAAISLQKGGVIVERCYGCGRCLPVCPYDRIRASNYVRNASNITELLSDNVNAIEIHTNARNGEMFKKLWSEIADGVQNLNLVAVSIPDLGDSTLFSMNMLYSIMQPDLRCYNLWQLDGRPMSGDIGKGATREAITFAARLASIEGRPHGFLQLAGGTNSHTINCLKQVGLFQKMDAFAKVNEKIAVIGGVAYGGYARKAGITTRDLRGQSIIVGKVLHELQSGHDSSHIEDYPEHLLEALEEALALVGPVKCYEFSK